MNRGKTLHRANSLQRVKSLPWGRAVLATLFGTVLAAVAWAAAEPAPKSPEERRTMSRQLREKGNFKDAYDLLRPLATDPKTDSKQVSGDLVDAVGCLQQLGRLEETDALIEEAVAAQPKNWRLLKTAALQYRSLVHYGQVVAGKFRRGDQSGGGRFVNTSDRDRGRSLQLLAQALPTLPDVDATPEKSDFYIELANALLEGTEGRDAWRLQVRSEIGELPDYEDGHRGWGYGRRGHNGVSQKGAPVEADGKTPIFYAVPKSWDDAKNDGERWRWALATAVEADATRRDEVRGLFAEFLHEQFGVQTMASWGALAKSDAGDESGTYALDTLKDSETIAKLATGIKRFEIPEEFNPIAIWKDLAGGPKSAWGEAALDRLVNVYQDRRQYVTAAATLKKLIETYGPGVGDHRRAALKQITGNWGRFEPGAVQPAGTEPVIEYRYRNGEKVAFEARAIDIEMLLKDAKDYLKGAPKQLDWRRANVQDVGYRLIEENESKYLGAKVAEWTLDVKPRPGHVDDRVSVKTPIKQPGAYLVSANMAGGNVSRIVVWVADTVIVKKQLHEANWYYVADATTGEPVPKANVEFFGWRQVAVDPTRNLYTIKTDNFAQFTDANGQIILTGQKLPADRNWLAVARTPQGRLAYLGFSGVWYGHHYEQEYNEKKVFTITDRPVYRPEQTVQWKFWIGQAKYDQPSTDSPFAGQTFSVEIADPQGEKVLETQVVADKFGGLAGEYGLPKRPKLGVYQVYIKDHGGSSFRVEEYKKPEFEVTVEAPKEPVQLGEKITAKIQAKYYFGSPVAKGLVKYKVLRTNYDNQWFPSGKWDWLYGRGYWWFAGDSPWYPGFGRWGCFRPIGWWWHHAQPQPEVILENEVMLSADGTVSVEIDTLPAKELMGTVDHRYSIEAEVVDESRRTITGAGAVLVAREPFKVFAWVDRGYFRTGDVVEAGFQVQTLDEKPVAGKGRLSLLQVSYDKEGEPVETEVGAWDVDPDDRGGASHKFNAAKPGQYRLSYRVTDKGGHVQEGGYLFVVRGDKFDGKEFRFNDLELIANKREYAAGEKVELLVNTNRAGAAVALFVRPSNGVYLPPKVVKLTGKSTVVEIAVTKKDMPNFFVEAVTVAGAKVFTEMKEIVVPPEQRVFDVQVVADQTEYLPGAEAKVTVKLTDVNGKPVVGSTVLSVYDRAVEYISGGSNVPDIKEFFWKWRRQHSPRTESSLDRYMNNLLKPGEIGMSDLGAFGGNVVEEFRSLRKAGAMNGVGSRARFAAPGGMGGGGLGGVAMDAAMPAAAPMAASEAAPHSLALGAAPADKNAPAGPGGGPVGGFAETNVRTAFADTAYWAGSVDTDERGLASFTFKMPENLTGWKVRAWGMGAGTRVGDGAIEVTTKKNLLVRLQAPRFFVQKDEVVLSANIHNYLKTDKKVRAILEIDELEGAFTSSLDAKVERVAADNRAGKVPGWELPQDVTIPAGGELRVDWRVRIDEPGKLAVRMKGLSDEESDAMEMTFPVYVHGMLKMESFTGVVRPSQGSAAVKIRVPEQRRINDSRIEVRYSPTLAGAMVDALPYLVDYPYGCTEQTLNRFLPTVITQRILRNMGVDLKEIVNKRTNLNAQEIGDDQARAARWQPFDRNPVFDEDEVRAMVETGVARLTGMQLSDGGWGWFSGSGEYSWPHTTAVVVHGLQIAAQNDVAIVPDVTARGVAWLQAHQTEQVRLLKNAPKKIEPWKERTDATDALIYHVLADADIADTEMRDFLFRDRIELPVYAKALFGIALHKQGQAEQLQTVLENIRQFVVEDEENETAYLRLPEDGAWWMWYGGEIEANAFYLKLLARVEPQGVLASRLVKYLLNNRRHGTHWNSTRDTAYVIEALAEYLKASGEDAPDMTIEVWLDGKKEKEAVVSRENLFSFDNKFVLFGDAVATGDHTVEIRRKGKGPVYFNAYVTNFTLEDFITKAGLEIKVDRKFYRLKPVDKKVVAAGDRGQVAMQKVEKYEREALENLATVTSGDLIEIELEIDSKNDYEYLCFEDLKASGMEPVDVRSGYTGQGLGAYTEYRDERVCFFVRSLPRGKHSLSYRIRAEVPGRFSALPTVGYAMYAPELKANSDEMKISIGDRKLEARGK